MPAMVANSYSMLQPWLFYRIYPSVLVVMVMMVVSAVAVVVAAIVVVVAAVVAVVGVKLS